MWSRADTKGTSEAVNAKYELMERGGYLPTGYKFDPVVLDANLPLEFLRSAECGAHCEIRRRRDSMPAKAISMLSN